MDIEFEVKLIECPRDAMDRTRKRPADKDSLILDSFAG